MNKEKLSWFLKGLAMGTADSVPGVSGGTIALITGIYERLIGALASFKPSLWGFIQKKDFKGLWSAIDGTFLICLGSGILLSLFTALSLMHTLLEVARPAVMSFFMGVIILSLWFLGRGLKWATSDFFLILGGLIVSVAFATAGRVELTPTPMILIFGGVLAISAMLLPGVSGSFMLLLLGLYDVVLKAVHDREIAIILWVGLGCVIGVIAFSRALQFLLLNWHDKVIRFMLGFIAGALVAVWPWQAGVSWHLPKQYGLITGNDPMLIASGLAFISGSIIVIAMQIKSRPTGLSR